MHLAARNLEWQNYDLHAYLSTWTELIDKIHFGPGTSYAKNAIGEKTLFWKKG
jgi:hypothetical protein